MDMAERKPHYHVAIISGFNYVPPVVTNDLAEALAAYLKAVEGFCLITGAEIVEKTNERTIFSDSSIIRITPCNRFCLT